MKKGFGKKIIFLGVSLILGISTVNASCALTGIAKTTNGYVQGSSNCNLMMYCVSYGKAQVWDTNKCRVYQLNGEALSTIQALGGGSTDSSVLGAKLAAFRYWSQGTTLNTGRNINYNSLDSLGKQYVDSVKVLSKDFTKTSIDGKGNFNFTLQSSNQSGSSYTATVLVTSEGSITGDLSFKASNGTNIVSSSKNANGSYTLVINGTIEECEGANPTIYVYSSSPGDSQSTTIPGIVIDSSDFYYFDCGTSQHYIGFTQDSSTKAELRKTSSTSTEVIPGKNLVGEGTVSIPDKECDCDAAISEDFTCTGEEETTKFLRETNNILGCIVSGRYTNYCNSSIRKNLDNNSKSVTTIPTSVSTNIDISNNNQYCSVYCIEDIDYELPGKINVKNGSYFTLENGTNNSSVTIKGKRRCYTNNIKTSKYVSDMIDKQKEIISQYNEYLRKKALYKAMESKPSKTSEIVCSTQTCTKKKLSAGTSLSKGVYDVGSVSYKQIECNYNDGTGEANCKSKDQEESLKVTETYNGSTESTSSCDGVSYISQCGILLGDLEEQWLNKKNEYRNYESHLGIAKSLSGDLKTIIQKYKSCSNWTNNYCFNPKVTFNYEDGEIYTDVNNQLLKEDGDPSIDQPNVTYYKSVNNEYEGQNTEYNEIDVNYVYVTSESKYEENSKIDFNVKYVKSEVDASKSFKKGSVKVCTYHPYGTILTGDSCSDSKDKILLGSDGYVFPVSLEKKENRQYNYNLIFSNIGVAGNDASCDNAQTNRLMGCENGNDLYEVQTSKSEPKYTCQYSSCPECNVNCVCPEGSTNCYVEDEVCKFITCDDCNIKCVGCLWNNGDSTFAYKQVSVSDVFPNSAENKDVGYNWNTDPKINTNAKKAKDTLEEIEDNAQKVYKTPEYSYTLTPTTMGKIRKYNELANKDAASSTKWGEGNSTYEIPKGGYNNDTLTCTNGITCTSSFLDGLDAIVGTDNRKRNEQWINYDDGSAWK